MYVGTLLIYLAFVFVIMRAALKNRQQGWQAGALLGFLLLTVPLWAVLLIWMTGAMGK